MAASGGAVGCDGGGNEVGDAVLGLTNECGRDAQARGYVRRGFTFLQRAPDVGITWWQGDMVQYVPARGLVAGFAPLPVEKGERGGVSGSGRNPVHRIERQVRVSRVAAQDVHHQIARDGAEEGAELSPRRFVAPFANGSRQADHRLLRHVFRLMPYGRKSLHDERRHGGAVHLVEAAPFRLVRLLVEGKFVEKRFGRVGESGHVLRLRVAREGLVADADRAVRGACPELPLALDVHLVEHVAVDVAREDDVALVSGRRFHLHRAVRVRNRTVKVWFCRGGGNVVD